MDKSKPSEKAVGDAPADDAPLADETEPDVFPVDFEEWATSRAAYEYVLVAGYRATVRQAGDLLKRKAPSVWDEGYAAYGGQRTS